MRNLIALIAGGVFGAGLYVSMMANPEKVLAFLDLAGAWDPSLLLVMGSAVVVAGIGFALSRRMDRAISGETFSMPASTAIDRRLLTGAALFGIGWGMTGYCPGPGFAALVVNPTEALGYLAAMLLGMTAFGWLPARRSKPPVQCD